MMNIQNNNDSISPQQTDTQDPQISPEQNTVNNVAADDVNTGQQTNDAPSAQPAGTGSAPATEWSAPQANTAPGTSVDPDPERAAQQTQSGVEGSVTAPPQSFTPNPASNGDTSTQTKAYLVKYALYLIITGTLISLAISFFSGIVESIGMESAGSGWAAEFAYQVSLVQLSTAIVFAVAFWFLARQCYEIERHTPDIKQHRWRKGFLGLFLIIIGLAALSTAVTLVYTLVSLVASIGVTSVDGLEVAKSIINNLFGVFVLASTFMLYARDYSTQRMHGLLRSLHHYGLLAAIIVLAVLFIALPLRGQRDSFIDGIATDDIDTLHSKIDDYALENDELPGQLSDLEVDDGLEERLDDYEYTADTASFEICAEFRTDTTEEEGSGNPIEDALSSSGLRAPTPDENDPDHHKEGRECFEYDALGVNGFGNSNSSLFERQRQNNRFGTTGQIN